MSRIGKLPINIPAGVTVDIKDNVVTVKGPKGELSQTVNPSIKVSIENGQVLFTIDEENTSVEQKQKQAYHGLYRSLINNMVVGVSEGFNVCDLLRSDPRAELFEAVAADDKVTFVRGILFL